MIFQGKLLRDIEEADLLGLIGTSSENDPIDFKQDIYAAPTPEGKAQKKIELCKDVSAFANANGGWIVCGMKETKGIASDLSGLGDKVDPDKEILRLRETVEKGVEPPIIGLDLKPVRLSDPNKGFAIVIRIPQSANAPHWVKDTKQFWVRRPNGKGQMNLVELRNSFNLAESAVVRARAFRAERLEMIQMGSPQLPTELEQGLICVLHCIPVNSAPNTIPILDKFMSDPANVRSLNPLSMQQSNYHHNFEGFLFKSSRVGTRSERYTQVFRDGIVECVRVLRIGWDSLETQGIISPYLLENEFFALLQDGISLQKVSAVEPPIAVMASLINIKDLRFRLRDQFDTGVPIRHNLLAIPDTVLTSYSDEPLTLMKPIFDIMWNASGWDRSGSYDEDGKFNREYRRN